MEVYDTANRLASQIKASEEYVNFKSAKQFINMNPELKSKVDEFENLRYNQQINMIKSGTQNKEEFEKTQKLYTELIQIEEIKKYFEAELRFNVMLADVNKIITEAVQDIIK